MRKINLLLCVILMASMFGKTAKSQTLIKTVDLSSILSPDGVGRPDVVAIGDTLYLAYSILTERHHHLVKMQADTNLTVLSSSPIELFSGYHDKSVDLRISKANNKFWYAFADHEWNASVDSTYFLNAAWYSANDTLVAMQTDISTGIGTIIPDAFSTDPNDVPINPEATDDPTPFWHNNLYYIFTRAWSGWIPQFTPNSNHHIRVFDNSFNLTNDYILDLSTAIPGKTLSQNTLININGQVYLIGGFYNARNDVAGGSSIYAVPLSNNLTSLSATNDTIPLLTEAGKWFHKVTAARVYNGMLFINYEEFIAGNDKQKIAIFDIGNNYQLMTTLEISSFPLGGGGVVANHTSFEIMNDLLFVFYPELNQKIYTKIFSLDNLMMQIADNISTDNHIKIYPNPTSGFFTIKGKDIQSVEITNISGQIIKQLSTNTEEFIIDMSGQPVGIYMVKIATKNGISVEKILINE